MKDKFRGWKDTIREQRRRVKGTLENNPSINREDNLIEILSDAYNVAVSRAEDETGLKTFPKECPYSFKEITNDAFFTESNIIKTFQRLKR